MARTKSPFMRRVEYYPLRGLLRGLSVLPWRWNKTLCRLLIHGILRLLPKRRRLIDSQMAMCFPDQTLEQRALLAKQSINYLADGVAMFSRIAGLAPGGMTDQVVVEGFHHIEDAYKAGKGMITFTAHYGCWELMAVYVTRHYPRVSMVVRPLDNPLLDQMVGDVRGSGGGGVINSQTVFKEGLRLLRQNGVLGVLVDQNFYKGGVFVDFFGHQAATSTLVPILARRTGCAVLPMHNVWEGDKIRIICEAPLVLSSSDDSGQAILEDTQQLTSIVEKWVREDPAQWLWLHNRWKRQPEAVLPSI